MSGGDPRIAVVMLTHNRREEVLASLDRMTRLPERPRIVVISPRRSASAAASS